MLAQVESFNLVSFGNAQTKELINYLEKDIG
jgi:hypothetical protein